MKGSTSSAEMRTEEGERGRKWERSGGEEMDEGKNVCSTSHCSVRSWDKIALSHHCFTLSSGCIVFIQITHQIEISLLFNFLNF